MYVSACMYTYTYFYIFLVENKYSLYKPTSGLLITNPALWLPELSLSIDDRPPVAKRINFQIQNKPKFQFYSLK